MEKRKTKLRYSLLKNTFYTTETLVNALGCSPDTIYKLNKMGMPHVEGSRSPYKYDGVEVKEFLKELYKPTKLLDIESYCVSCKKRSTRLLKDVTINYKRTKKNGEHSLNIEAKCLHCNKTTNRFCDESFANRQYPGLAVMGLPSSQLGMSNNTCIAGIGGIEMTGDIRGNNKQKRRVI